ncbi:type II toxin-antitoxin system prevent-host-death family antitoxin [Candidatus Binatia bacterium]|nr:type II toxin-antitoxin system prevent-host-death family antitoxin [Candidatus Binatia bacterium]
MAKTYPIYEAKAKLSAILREVKRGRLVTISERGEPIAVIAPVKRDRDLESRLLELERAGAIQRASAPLTQIRPICRRSGAVRRFLETRE